MNIFLAVFTTIAFWVFPTLAQEKGVLRVGVIQSLSGIAAEDGKTVMQALELARETLSESGQRVEMLVEDDQSNSIRAVTAFQKLISQAPDAIIAATWDFTTIPLVPLAKRYRTVLFNTSTLPESIALEEGGGFAFANAVTVAAESEPFVKFIRTRAVRSLVIAHASNAWGEVQLKRYSERAIKEGVKILDVIKPAGYDENEWRAIASRVKAKQAEAILLLLNKQDLEMFLRRAKEISLPGAIFASINAYDALRLTDAKTIYEGLCFTYPLTRLASEGAFVERYKQRFGEEPRIYADNTYDALLILEQAWREAHVTHVSLAVALKQTTFTGLVGPYKYTSEHSLTLGDSSLVCVEKGEPNISD